MKKSWNMSDLRYGMYQQLSFSALARVNMGAHCGHDLSGFSISPAQREAVARNIDASRASSPSETGAEYDPLFVFGWGPCRDQNPILEIVYPGLRPGLS